MSTPRAQDGPCALLRQDNRRKKPSVQVLDDEIGCEPKPICRILQNLKRVRAYSVYYLQCCKVNINPQSLAM